MDILEEKIDLEHVAQARTRNLAALNYEPVDRLPINCLLPSESEQFQTYPRLEAFEDAAKMMVNELLGGFGSAYQHILGEVRDDAPHAIRASLGVGIIASVFGSKVSIIDDNMPWAWPLEGGIDAMYALADAPLPDVTNGLGRRIVDFHNYFNEMLDQYPKCREAIEVVMPDLQGPWSTLELLWGSSIYIDLFEHEDLIRRLLHKVTEQSLAVYNALKDQCHDSLVPENCHQMGTAAKGAYIFRNDSVINISQAMYRDLVAPYDTRVSEALGGVGFHSCGDVTHMIDNLLAIPQVKSLDFGEPEKNNLDSIYERAAPKKVALLKLRGPVKELDAEKMKARFPTGVILSYSAKSTAQAKEILARYTNGAAA